jgi:hypothetical protein
MGNTLRSSLPTIENLGTPPKKDENTNTNPTLFGTFTPIVKTLL